VPGAPINDAFLMLDSIKTVPAFDWSGRRRLLVEKWPIRKTEGLCLEAVAYDESATKAVFAFMVGLAYDMCL
jgi:hypothetical protein